MSEIDNAIGYLKEQISFANCSLFLGAGFSKDLKSQSGDYVPDAEELRQLLWGIAFPGQILDSSELDLVYESALKKAPDRTTELLQNKFNVAQNNIPEWYQPYFRFPWKKIYTLNIDTLDYVWNLVNAPTRKLRIISATSDIESSPLSQISTQYLDVVHLNGCLIDVPNKVTFSKTQYLSRLANEDPWYSCFVGELSTSPMIFVGTTIDEDPLWRHIELRKGRLKDDGEYRKKSILVTPEISAGRKDWLRRFNIVWLPLKASEFSEQVLGKLFNEALVGQNKIGKIERPDDSEFVVVNDIQQNTVSDSKYLLGAEPEWHDIFSSRVIKRDFEESIFQEIKEIKSIKNGSFIVLRGTAGSGKSTTARKFAMNLVAEGYRVAWIDRTNEVVYSELRSDIIKRKINTLVIDDAEGQSIGLFNIISELIIEGIIISALCVVDTSRKANEIKSVLGVNINFTELVIPYLTKNDAQRLVDALEKDGKIGELSRLKPAERSLKLLEGSESQLLVAMIRAVSNERFDVKVRKEYTSLLDLEKRIYSLACIATLGGSSLYFRDFVQLIKNDPNSIMAHIEHLLQSGLLVHETGSGDRIRARHRVIAAEVRKKIADDGHLQNVLESLGWLLGMTISNPPKSSQRNFRLFKWLMNHRVICEQLGIVGAREFYGKILETSRHLAHFWLQRGAFEAQFGEIDLAENYLRQALAKSPRDPQILTEWYFIRLRKACSDPKSDGSKEAAVEAISGLKTLIADRGSIDRYPYHVLGSQGFSWLMKGELSISEKKDLRTELVILLEEGYLKHNGADDLKVLLSDIQRKTLGF